MASHELIDAQFDRAVEIVQSLPKTGPIQTDYEEKLQMYSLYKQATVGNVQSPRPGIWDMLGRAKWDAWAKHKDLDPYEAKWLYVEALLKVLRRYSDKTIAQNLVQELESYRGDPSNLVMSQSSMKSPASDSSSSTASRDFQAYPQKVLREQSGEYTGEGSTEEDGSEPSSEDEAGELPRMPHTNMPYVSPHRPQSSLSAQRYQTPNRSSFAMSPTPSHNIPMAQPLPSFETPSAFPAPPTAPSPGPVYRQPAFPYPYESVQPQQPPSVYGAAFRGHGQTQSVPNLPPHRPASRITLERAIENVQAHLAALSERLESLEARTLHRSIRSSSHSSPYNSPTRRYGSQVLEWDLDDLGMWSYVLSPIMRFVHVLRGFARFFAKDESLSPTKAVLRRLCLDLSFLVCVVLFAGAMWRKSGVRRREVRAALVALWRAIVGSKPPRSLQGRH